MNKLTPKRVDAGISMVKILTPTLCLSFLVSEMRGGVQAKNDKDRYPPLSIVSPLAGDFIPDQMRMVRQT